MENLILFAQAFYLASPVINDDMIVYAKVPHQLDQTVTDANDYITRNGWHLLAKNNKCGGMVVCITE